MKLVSNIKLNTLSTLITKLYNKKNKKPFNIKI